MPSPSTSGNVVLLSGSLCAVVAPNCGRFIGMEPRHKRVDASSVLLVLIIFKSFKYG